MASLEAQWWRLNKELLTGQPTNVRTTNVKGVGDIDVVKFRERVGVVFDCPNPGRSVVFGSPGEMLRKPIIEIIRS